MSISTGTVIGDLFRDVLIIDRVHRSHISTKWYTSHLHLTMSFIRIAYVLITTIGLHIVFTAPNATPPKHEQRAPTWRELYLKFAFSTIIFTKVC